MPNGPNSITLADHFDYFQTIEDYGFNDAQISLAVILILYNPILRSITIKGNLTGLKKLKISSNPSLTYLSLTLSHNSSLEHLLLDNNAFTSVNNSWFRNLPLLKEVSLANNSLREFYMDNFVT